MDFYALLRGPLAWVAILFCICGSALRMIIILNRIQSVDRLNPGKSFIGGLKSIIRGLIPFGSPYMREKPVFTLTTFAFHLCVLIAPLFAIGHIVLVYESWNLQWSSLPDSFTDIMTILVMAGVLFFAARRLLVKEVKYLTKVSDWLLLFLIGAVFLTALLSAHHWGPYRPLLIAHILFGEGLLVVIPFSKLIHMFFFFYTRGYLGAEYEIVLNRQYL